MSDRFNSNDYSEYFEKLNSRLGGSAQKPATPPATKNKKGCYKTVRLNRRALAIALAVVLLLIAAFSLKACAGKKAENPIGLITENNGVKAEKEDASPKPEDHKIAFKTDTSTLPFPDGNDCKTGIVVRLSDSKIIAERDKSARIYPASTLKIMTLLTAVDYIKDLDDTFTMTYEITDPLFVKGASVAGFSDGESVTLRDLLYGMILPSGADAAMGLAVKLAGSEKAFVELMNKKVKEMGLSGTHFTNVSGLHDQENYSTAYDMAVITCAAYKNELCREVLSTYQYTTEKTPEHPDGILLSSTLFSYMYGTEPETAKISGGKTGFVNESGYCVASFGKANQSGEEYIAVTMGNSSKWPAFYGQIDLYKQFAK